MKQWRSGFAPAIANIIRSHGRADPIGFFLVSGTMCNLTDHARWVGVTHPFDDENYQFKRLSGFIAIADMLVL